MFRDYSIITAIRGTQKYNTVNRESQITIIIRAKRVVLHVSIIRFTLNLLCTHRNATLMQSSNIAFVYSIFFAIH